MKFGGTSLGSRERIETALSLVRAHRKRAPILVCSAHSGVTDLLLAGARAAAAGSPDPSALRTREETLLRELDLDPALIAPELEQVERLFEGLSALRELTPRSLDKVAAFGERMSVKAIAALLRRARIPATPVQADEAGLVTTDRYTRATPLPAAYANLERALGAVRGIPVVTGFIGRDEQGHVTTLGRSGSDYTATIVGRAVGAEEVQIWTDVSGVLTADPRIVPQARPVSHLTYAEAGELAYYGAKVIHPATVPPAVEKGIPIRILNTLDPKAPGTWIGPAGRREGEAVASIACKAGIHLVNIVSGRMLGQSGFMARVFDVFRAHDVSVDLIATSEVSVTVSVDRAEGLRDVLRDLSKVARSSVEEGNALVAVIGERMRGASGLALRVFHAVASAGVPLRAVSYGATKTNLQLVVPQARMEDTVRRLHGALFDGGAGGEEDV